MIPAVHLYILGKLYWRDSGEAEWASFFFFFFTYDIVF